MVFKLIQQYISQLAGKMQILAMPLILKKLKNGIYEKGIVVEIGIEVAPAILMRRQ